VLSDAFLQDTVSPRTGSTSSNSKYRQEEPLRGKCIGNALQYSSVSSYSYTVKFIDCFDLCMIHSVHMTSMTPVHPGEGSSSVALLKVSSLFPVKGCLGVFPDVRFWDRDVYVYRL